MTKVCQWCKTEKQEEEFYWKFKAKNIRQRHCKTCQKAYTKAWYVENTDKHRKATATARKKYYKSGRKLIWDYAKKHGCAICGIKDPRVLEYDHISGTKLACVSELVGSSRKRLLEEIAKCQILCANCHRIKTAKSLKYYLGA